LGTSLPSSTELTGAGEMQPVAAGRPLGVLDTFRNQTALELRTAARMVTISSLAAAIVAEVEPPQQDVAFFKILDDLQRVRGRPEHAIHLGRDDDIARLDDSE